jgi:5-methylcytosine-specific restriction endonuclease McrA
MKTYIANYDYMFYDYENYYDKLHKSTWQTEHAQYLQTKEWKDKRELVLARDGRKCTDCGSTENLQIHHLTYDHFKNEPLEDLVTLCNICHTSRHAKIYKEREHKPKPN